MLIRLDRTLSCILIEKVYPSIFNACSRAPWCKDIGLMMRRNKIKKKNAIQSTCSVRCLIPFQFAWADVWVCCLKDYTHLLEFIPQNSAWLPAADLRVASTTHCELVDQLFSLFQ